MYDTQWNIIQPQGKEILLYHRSSKPKLGSCLSVSDLKRPPWGLADVDIPFITHGGECTRQAAGQSDRDRTSSSPRLVIRGPRQRQHRIRLHKPTCSQELHYISVYVQKEKVKKQSQDKKPLSKGDKERVTIHSQNNTHSFWPEAFQLAVSHGTGKGHVTTPQLPFVTTGVDL